MADKLLKRYLFASDFDQTLTFNDSGYVLSELVGIPTAEFERKAKGMAKLNLVQQGAELAYLLLHDPEFRSRVRREHLYQVGKIIRLKENIELLSKILESGIEGYQFDFYVLSAAPVEVIQSALEGMLPADHIYGTEFRYNAEGGIDSAFESSSKLPGCWCRSGTVCARIGSRCARRISRTKRPPPRMIWRSNDRRSDDLTNNDRHRLIS